MRTWDHNPPRPAFTSPSESKHRNRATTLCGRVPSTPGSGRFAPGSAGACPSTAPALGSAAPKSAWPMDSGIKMSTCKGGSVELADGTTQRSTCKGGCEGLVGGTTRGPRWRTRSKECENTWRLCQTLHVLLKLSMNSADLSFEFYTFFYGTTKTFHAPAMCLLHSTYESSSLVKNRFR